MPRKTRRKVQRKTTRKVIIRSKLKNICPCSPDVGDCPQCAMPKRTLAKRTE